MTRGVEWVTVEAQFLTVTRRPAFDPSTELPPSFDNFRLRMPTCGGPAMAGQDGGTGRIFNMLPPSPPSFGGTGRINEQ